MVIAVPQEIFPGENRVALVPAQVPALIGAGHRVVIEPDAGKAAGYPDDQYRTKGAEIANNRQSLLADAEAVFLVRGPAATGVDGNIAIDSFRSGQTVIGFFNPLMAGDAVTGLADGGVTVFALELIPRISRAQSMDALSAMANLAGYKAVLMAANTLPKIFPLMMTAAGSLRPATVFVIGAGVAGLQACATAKRLGAVVHAYDLRPEVKEQVESVGASFVEFDLATDAAGDSQGYAQAQSDDFYRRQQAEMTRVIAESDVVITTAGVPGKRAPVLITEAMVEAMAPGSVIVDVVAELGGNCALTQPGKDVTAHDVTIMGPENIPALLAHHASQLLSKNIVTLFEHLTDESGGLTLDLDDPITADTLVCHDGAIRNERVADAIAAEK